MTSHWCGLFYAGLEYHFEQKQRQCFFIIFICMAFLQFGSSYVLSGYLSKVAGQTSRLNGLSPYCVRWDVQERATGVTSHLSYFPLVWARLCHVICSDGLYPVWILLCCFRIPSCSRTIFSIRWLCSSVDNLMFPQGIWIRICSRALPTFEWLFPSLGPHMMQ